MMPNHGIGRYGGFRRLNHDPNARNYSDIALTPVDEDRSDEMELVAMGAGVKAAVVKIQESGRN
jgi:hypothetical protein